MDYHNTHISKNIIPLKALFFLFQSQNMSDTSILPELLNSIDNESKCSWQTNKMWHSPMRNEITMKIYYEIVLLQSGTDYDYYDYYVCSFNNYHLVLHKSKGL